MPDRERRRSRGALRAIFLTGAVILPLGALARIVALRAAAERGVDPEDSLRHALGLAPRPTAHPWGLVFGRHWQIASEEREPAAITDAREGTRGACAEGMVHVEGRYLLDKGGAASSLGVEMLQDEACTSWISREFPARCAAFDRAKWLGQSSALPRRELRFCIDRFEYPNTRGQNPVVVVSFIEAQAICARASKRLCSEVEWTFACEGEEGLPFPNGYVRDAEGCVVDRAWREWDEAAFADRTSERARREVDRLWQGAPSGSHPRCRSPFGVYDLTGNVDEWTRSTRKDGFASILKGGYWGPIRGRCRPSTRAHGETFVAYQQGLRCCADAPAQAPEAAEAASEPPEELRAVRTEEERGDELAAPAGPPPAAGCGRAP